MNLCTQLLVTNPSSELLARMSWLAVRNCLAHRLGQVQMADVRPAGTPLEQTPEGARLNVTWLEPVATIDGVEISSFPHVATNGGTVSVELREIDRSWGIGERVDVTATDCQAISISLSLVATEMLRCFVQEIEGGRESH